MVKDMGMTCVMVMGMEHGYKNQYIMYDTARWARKNSPGIWPADVMHEKLKWLFWCTEKWKIG